MDQALSRDYRFPSLLRFALPSIVMMVFMSLYSIVDGVFVSRFVSTAALSAVNIVFPVSSVIIGLAVMLATGGSALIARKLGEGRPEEARRGFSLVVLAGVALAAAVMLLGLVFLRPLCLALGANEALLPLCERYLRILLLFAPASVLQMLFQSFFITAGKPGIGLFLTVLAGVTNAVLDYVFIVPLQMGIQGAALATAAGYLVPAVSGLVYFLVRRGKGVLWFVRPKWDGAMLWKSCCNGSSEMVSNLASAVITFLFNVIMMRLLGEDGVAAITIVLYGQFMLSALYLGFSMGVAPILSYNFGAGNFERLRRLVRVCLLFVSISSVGIFFFAEFFSSEMVAVFSPRGTAVFDTALHGFRLFALCYLFSGTSTFASALFTALSDGKTSALISFLRTFGLILPALIALPVFWGVDGVWMAVPLAELLTILLAGALLLRWVRRTPRQNRHESNILPISAEFS